MRVLFEGHLPDEEREILAELDLRIDEFWLTGAPHFSNTSLSRLHQIDKRFRLERWSSGWGLVTDDPAARPLVERIASRAPASLQPIISWRPQLEVLEACKRIRATHQMDLSESRFRVGFIRGHLLDVTAYVSDTLGASEEEVFEAVEELVEWLLGQQVYERWLGSISVEPGLRRSSLPLVERGTPHQSAVPLRELASIVEAGCVGLHAGLPDAPLSQGSGEEGWTMLEAEPVADGRFAAKDDLIMASTRTPELLKCFLEGAPFASERFSRVGECFCYLKLDQRDLSDDERLARRTELEELVDRGLRQAQIGCVTGTGFGLHHAYIDVALTNLDPGATAILDLTKSINESGWLQFCDTELSEQWLGLGATRRSPPGLT